MQRPRSNQSEVAPARGTLTCTRGPEEGLTLQLMEGSYTIGRARENSFVLKDIAASRRHIRIDVDGRGARLVDLGSGNGSRLNGRRVSEAELRHGDRIEIGGSVLVYADAGQKAPSGDPKQQPDSLADDAQERVIRAAEKLAAELSERMRFGEGPQAGFEDGHVARTRALPKADKEAIAAEARRQAAQQQHHHQHQDRPQGNNAQKLWNETFTNMPLNEIVPANDPLRGTRGVPPPPPAELVINSPPPPPMRAPQRRAPMPPPMAMPPAEDPSFSDGRSGSFMLSLLASALVVIFVGVVVLGVYWVTHRGKERDEATISAEYERAIRQAEDAAFRDDWKSVLSYSSAAQQLKPNDPDAARWKKRAEEKIDLLTRGPAPPLSPPGTTAPPPSAAPQPLQPAPPAPPLSPPGTAAPPVAAQPVAAQPVAAQPVAAQPVAAQPVAAQPPRAAQPPPTAQPPPAAAQPPAQPDPPPKRVSKPPSSSPPAKSAEKPEKPKKKGGGKMSDADAQELFAEAVNTMRNKDTKGGCKMLQRIADGAPGESVWKQKADNLIERRCQDL
jgi:hypothetical protein